MHVITPFLWFDDKAEEAAELYVSLFPGSTITHVARWGEGGPTAAGAVMSVSVVLDGLALQLFNGGPGHPFTDAISFFVQADTQPEIDRLWGALTDGGAEVQCGWLTDRFGLSWQVVPSVLLELLSDPDAARAGRAMQAMLGMRKLDIAALRAAADGMG